jgi:AcrR family transcriptional regulator
MSNALHASSREEIRERIVRQAFALLQKSGAAALTTRGVAAASAVQAPTIYRLFGDKEGLLDAVAEHAMSTYVAAKAVDVESAEVENFDPLDDLRAGFRMQVEFGLTNPTLFMLLSDPERGLDSPAGRAGLAVLQRRVRRLATQGRLRVSEDRAVQILRAAGTGAVLTTLSAPLGERNLDLADAMFNAFRQSAVTDAPSIEETSPVAIAVALRASARDLTALTRVERELLREWLDRIIDYRKPTAATASLPDEFT